jgi:hypothetical protein
MQTRESGAGSRSTFWRAAGGQGKIVAGLRAAKSIIMFRRESSRS